MINLVEESLIKKLTPTFLDKALAPPAQEIGNVLGNIFHLIFSPVYYPTQKYRIKQTANLKKFEEDIQKELEKIPEENLIEPPLNIVGPALEASKFHIEEEEVRRMFAKLIASSMDKDNSSSIHPSFVEIIKQMSSLDAINLKIIESADILPIARYLIQHTETSGKNISSEHNFLSNSNCQDMSLIRTSITNLSRLGLINIEYSKWFSDEQHYEIFNQSPVFMALLNLKNRGDFFDVEIEKGVTSCTPLGKHFVRTCT